MEKKLEKKEKKEKEKGLSDKDRKSLMKFIEKNREVFDELAKS